MYIAIHAARLLGAHKKRFILFLGLAALLCTAAGLLGNYFLYGEGSVEPVSLLVVDLDDSQVSRLAYGFIAEQDEYSELLRFEKTSEADALERLRAGDATAAVVFPEGFAESVMVGENKSFKILYSTATPLKAQLVGMYADAYTGMLRTSQIGTYTALAYARDQGGSDAYNAMLLNVNMAYLRTVGEKRNAFREEEVLATGHVGVFLYYIFHALLFLLTLSPVLLLDIAAPLFTPYLRGELRRRGAGAWSHVVGGFGGVWLCYLSVAVVGLFAYAAASRVLSLPGAPAGFWLCMAVVLAFVAAVAILVTTLGGGPGGGVLLFVYAAVSLFFSGGIIPWEYLSPGIRGIGVVMPQYWCSRLLQYAWMGQFDGKALAIVTAYTLLLLGVAGISMRRREGTLN